MCNVLSNSVGTITVIVYRCIMFRVIAANRVINYRCIIFRVIVQLPIEILNTYL